MTKSQELQPNTEVDKPFLATFGSWEDDRSVEKIIEDIYMHRTVSDAEHEFGLTLKNWAVELKENHE